MGLHCYNGDCKPGGNVVYWVQTNEMGLVKRTMNLLFVLSDRNRRKVLAKKAGAGYRFPAYDELVSENVGFDEPQLYNDFFRERTGIPAFRRYSFNTEQYVVFAMEQIDADILPANEFAWVAFDDFINTEESGELRNVVRSVSLCYDTSVNMPWVNASGFTAYFDWLHHVCAAQGIRINGEIT